MHRTVSHSACSAPRAGQDQLRRGRLRRGSTQTVGSLGVPRTVRRSETATFGAGRCGSIHMDVLSRGIKRLRGAWQRGRVGRCVSHELVIMRGVKRRKLTGVEGRRLDAQALCQLLHARVTAAALRVETCLMLQLGH
jgi:hypothetical protein